MPGFLDIAPLVESVTIRGVECDVRGIEIRDIAYLMRRFPEIASAFFSQAAAQDEGLDAWSLIDKLGPSATAAVICCAIGRRGDAAHEKVAASLALGEQGDLFLAILRLTMPGGLLPFVDRLTLMLGDPGAPARAEIGKAPDTSSPQPSTS